MADYHSVFSISFHAFILFSYSTLSWALTLTHTHTHQLHGWLPFTVVSISFHAFILFSYSTLSWALTLTHTHTHTNYMADYHSQWFPYHFMRLSCLVKVRYPGHSHSHSHSHTNYMADYHSVFSISFHAFILFSYSTLSWALTLTHTHTHQLHGWLPFSVFHIIPCVYLV